MEKPFSPLRHRRLAPGAVVAQPPSQQPRSIGLEDPAVRVMTDFRQTRPFTIGPRETMDRANDKMIACGVRLLLVVDGGTVTGLITATDILGEKPVAYLREHGGGRDGVLVQDIMTPYRDLEVLDMAAVARARVGDVVETLRQCGRQHLLVVEADAQGGERVRGLFSATQVGRQLGLAVEPTSRAETFAELESALAGRA